MRYFDFSEEEDKVYIPVRKSSKPFAISKPLIFFHNNTPLFNISQSFYSSFYRRVSRP